MNIEIITTPNKELEESGFGNLIVCKSVLESITAMGHDAILSICETKDDLLKIAKRKPDLVVLAVKHIINKDGDIIWLSDFFQENKINFSGSLKETLMFDTDKVLAKSHLKDKGISSPRYFTAIPGEYKRDYDIPINYPLFLKPRYSVKYNATDEASRVDSFVEFENKVLSLYNVYNVPVLVEEYLEGNDFTVSIIKTKDGDILVSAIEIIKETVDKSNTFLDEKIKKETKKKLIQIEDKILKNRIENLAIDAYMDLEIRDFGQITIKTNSSDHSYFMKVNLVPQMQNGSSRFTEALRMERGLTYNQIIELIVDEGMSRASLI